MRKTATQKMYDMFNLSRFSKDFICAGVRDNVLGLYNFLLEKGAISADKDLDSRRISSRKPIVLLCKNDGTNPKKQFARIQIMDRNWWNYYHNKRLKTCKSTTFRTYNIPSQWTVVLREGCVWKEVEVLKPEVV